MHIIKIATNLFSNRTHAGAVLKLTLLIKIRSQHYGIMLDNESDFDFNLDIWLSSGSVIRTTNRHVAVQCFSQINALQ